MKIKLPSCSLKGSLTTGEAIALRRSQRNYTKDALSCEGLSCLLYAGSGITGCHNNYFFRAAPSAGALYPIEIYLVVHRINGLKPGIYHYSVIDHSLELIKEGNFQKELTQAALGQEVVGKAACVFVMTAIPKRTTYKYGERGWRYIYMEAGHISQNLYLMATSLGLGICAVGAFFDNQVNMLFGLDEREEVAIYLNCVGRVK